MELQASLICDDVRYEIGNKLTAVGLYPESIIFGPGAGPTGLAKLAFVYVIRGLGGVQNLEYRHTLHLPPAVRPAVNNAPFSTQNHNPENDTHTFVLQVSPVVFPEMGQAVSELDVRVGSDEAHFELRFHVRRSLAGGAPTMH